MVMVIHTMVNATRSVALIRGVYMVVCAVASWCRGVVQGTCNDGDERSKVKAATDTATDTARPREGSPTRTHGRTTTHAFEDRIEAVDPQRCVAGPTGVALRTPTAGLARVHAGGGEGSVPARTDRTVRVGPRCGVRHGEEEVVDRDEAVGPEFSPDGGEAA